MKKYVSDLSTDGYHVYVYFTYMPYEAVKVPMEYMVAAEIKTLKTLTYPFEFIVEVTGFAQAFPYTLYVQKNRRYA